MTVRDLFLIQRVWDETKINQHFLPVDREIIKAISLSFFPSEVD